MNAHIGPWQQATRRWRDEGNTLAIAPLAVVLITTFQKEVLAPL